MSFARVATRTGQPRLPSLRVALGVAVGAARIAAAQPHSPPTPALVPFAVGEELIYHASFAGLPAGSARLRVVAIDTIRGRPAYHLLFTVDGGPPLLRIHDRHDSWIDVETLSSLRYVQQISEPHTTRTTTYEIYAESAMYRKNGGPPEPSVVNPLDDVSFLYAVRVAGIRVGETRSDDRYFIADRNPVVLTGVATDTINVHAGTFAATAVHPTIKTRGLFAENTDARIWFSNDANRYPIKVHTRVARFSVTLTLDSIRGRRPNPKR